MVVEKRSCTGVQRASQTACATRSRFFERPETAIQAGKFMVTVHGDDIDIACAYAVVGTQGMALIE